VVFFVDPLLEEHALDSVIRYAELTLPGRGTVFSEQVEMIGPSGLQRDAGFAGESQGVGGKLSPLVGLCCIVQRGEANKVARVALDMGSGVPTVSFGIGTGIRDKLGLLRIAVPAQKEIIHLTLTPHDAETVMRMMVQAGELDQPGKGFMFSYPIRKGVVDTKITYGFRRHVASIEQIIATLDELKGDMGWRRRSERRVIEIDERYFIPDLLDLTLICNEGSGHELVKQAMAAGAGGATIGKLKHHCHQGSKPRGMSSAREACSMCIAPSQREPICQALKQAGAFDERASGEVLIRPAPRAFTYR